MVIAAVVVKPGHETYTVRELAGLDLTGLSLHALNNMQLWPLRHGANSNPFFKLPTLCRVMRGLMYSLHEWLESSFQAMVTLLHLGHY